jgi:molecular chaperone GrpE
MKKPKQKSETATEPEICAAPPGDAPETPETQETPEILDALPPEGPSDDPPPGEPEDLRCAELTDRLQRTLADFDNFRKRSAKEKAGMYDEGVRDTLEKLLPLLDNFERALASAAGRDDAFFKGVELLLRQFQKLLDDLGVTVIPAVGQPFNPNCHHAVAHGEDPDQGADLVAEELQKGYLYKDKVIRPSMVKVVN